MLRPTRMQWNRKITWTWVRRDERNSQCSHEAFRVNLCTAQDQLLTASIFNCIYASHSYVQIPLTNWQFIHLCALRSKKHSIPHLPFIVVYNTHMKYVKNEIIDNDSTSIQIIYCIDSLIVSY